MLVDSERLAVRVEAEVLAGLGWPIGEAGVIERFLGRSQATMHAEVERHLGRAIDWDETFGAAHREAFERSLVAVDGVTVALDAIASAEVPVCVASSSTHKAIAFKLDRTGLADRFGDRIFSAEDVANEKPAPDLFLHAAGALAAEPARCAVIEDSPVGVEAGLAAGMAVYAYDGGLADRGRLERPGVTVFDAMAHLAALLGLAS